MRFSSFIFEIHLLSYVSLPMQKLSYNSNAGNTLPLILNTPFLNFIKIGRVVIEKNDSAKVKKNLWVWFWRPCWRLFWPSKFNSTNFLIFWKYICMRCIIPKRFIKFGRIVIEKNDHEKVKKTVELKKSSLVFRGRFSLFDQNYMIFLLMVPYVKLSQKSNADWFTH